MSASSGGTYPSGNYKFSPDVTDADLRITGTVESLKLEPGDRILVTIDKDTHGHWLSHARVAALKESVQEAFPGHEVTVLSGVSITTTKSVVERIEEYTA